MITCGNVVMVVGGGGGWSQESAGVGGLKVEASGNEVVVRAGSESTTEEE